MAPCTRDKVQEHRCLWSPAGKKHDGTFLLASGVSLSAELSSSILFFQVAEQR